MDKNPKLNRWMNKLLAVLFLAIVLVFSVLCIQRFFNRTMELYRDAEISELVQINATLESEMKNSFPGLRHFQNIKGLLYRGAGKTISDDFGYIKDNDGVVRIISPIRNTDLFDSISTLSDVLQDKGIPLVFVNLPDASEDVLGNFPIDGERHNSFIEQLRESGIDVFDIDADSLELQTNNITFHTDFHYTTEAEFKIAGKLSSYLVGQYGIAFANKDEVFSLGNYTVAGYEFVGNTVRNLGKHYTTKDIFEIYHPNFETEMELSIGKDGGYRSGDFSQVVLNGYEDAEYYDEYTYWVTNYGQFPQEVYSLSNKKAPDAAKLLVICDSIFMRSFSYLSLCSGQITVYDPRVDHNSTTLQMLLDEQEFDAVLVVGLCNDFFAHPLPLSNLDNSEKTVTLYVDTCNGENQTEQQTVQITPGAGSYHIYGWAGDVESGEPLSALYVKAGDKIYRCNYGIDRQSVVDYFQNENLRYTGFSVTLPESAFGNGAVEQLQFIGVSQSGTCRYEDYPYAVSYPVAPPAEEPAASPEMPMDEPTQQDSPMALVLMLCVIAIFVIVALFLWKKTSLGTKIEQHSFLFEELVKRDFTLKYKRTVLGAFWSLLSPLINLLIMWLVFNKMLGNNIDHFVIYLFAGQLVFGYFSEATNMGMTSLLDNASIFTKVNVPKYLFLFSRNISSLINFGITLLVFFLFVAMEGIPFTWKFLMLIYPALCLILINLGIGMILSALFVFFRDMQYLWGLALQLIMWMSAIFYSIDGFDQTIRNLFLLNPVYLCIRYFRKIVIENTVPALQFHLLLAAMAAAFFGIGCWMYKRYNTKFLYYV